MKNFFLICISIIFLIIYVYILSIENIPDNIILFNNEKLNISTLLGVSYETVNASSNLNKAKVSENSTVFFKLFDKITLKKVNLDVINDIKVVPLGNIVGLKLYTKGVLVVGMNEVENIEKNMVKPYDKTGIIEGDMIISVNNNVITCTADLLDEVNKSKGEKLQLEYLRNGNIYEANIVPEKIEGEKYKLGLWVRDSAAGVGIITFYEPSSGKFAALGHGIMDIDTGELLDIANGEIVNANVISISKGERGTPGEIKGSIVAQESIGEISRNTLIGIYGKINNISSLNIDLSKKLEIAKRSEIKSGKATILCALDNEKVKEYEIEIKKININDSEDNKSMVIKVIDKELLEKTNGIVQGMSGSPILQNGKLIGAITQVFVNSPNMGYAVFADLMVKEMLEVK